MSQNLQKSIDDGRLQKMLDSLGEDIKADDIMRDQAKYREVAQKFKGMTLEDKANVILGMEMDGKQLSTQALVTILGSLSESDYAQLGGRVAELIKSIGVGVGEGLKGLFGNFFNRAPEGTSERATQEVEELPDSEYKTGLDAKVGQIGTTIGNPQGVDLRSRVAKQIWEIQSARGYWEPYNPDSPGAADYKEEIYKIYLHALANPNTSDGRMILEVTDPSIYGAGTHGRNSDGSRSSGVSF